MRTEWFLLGGFVFIFGAMIGSFLNVCIFRIPEGKSIVSPPSSCPSCNSRIRWFQNVPIISYLFLAGKCANCGVKISIRYPMVEALTGGIFSIIFLKFGLQLSTPIYWLFAALLIAITFIDLDHQIIPDLISLPGILLGVSCSFFVPWLGWLDSVSGVLLGGGLLLAIAWGYQALAGREGMGGGDIKLLAMIGAFLGWGTIFPILFIASFLGSLIGVPLMLLKKGDGRLALPFGPFLSLAALIYLLFGGFLLEWYLSLW